MDGDERSELESLRERIVTRMHELQDKEEYGEITSQQRYETLREEFGAQYQHTLAEINTLLHQHQRHTEILPRRLIASMLSILLFAFAISALSMASPTGMMVFSEGVVIIEQQINPGQSVHVEVPENMIITSVQTTAPAHLILEDEQRKRTLLQGTNCVGCGQPMHAPYMIINAGNAPTTIMSVGVVKR